MLSPSFHKCGFCLAVVVGLCLCGLSHAAAPYSVTQPAGPVRATSATLNGMVVPRGEPSVAWFEWGTNGVFDRTTEPVEVGEGTATIRVSTRIRDLAPGGVYNFRIVASNASGVVRGFKHLLTTGMKIASWGDSAQGFMPGPLLTNVVAVACGHGHSLAIRNDGTVAAWMSSFYGNVGQTKVPEGLDDIVAVAGGYSHSLAVREDGTVVAWGADSSLLPVDVPADLANVIAVAAGDWHTVALKADGRVATWGSRNLEGQLNVPMNLSNVVAIAAGSTYSIALKADGTVVSWGRPLGTSSHLPPAGLTNVVLISAEGWHSLAMKSDGTVVGWGSASSAAAANAGCLQDATAVAAGFRHSIALTNNGQLVVWGDSVLTNLSSMEIEDAVSVASGDYHCVLLTAQNFGPTALGRTRTQPANRDSVVTLIGSDPNSDVLTYTLLSLPTNGLIFQYESTGRGDLITVPGPVSDPSGRIIYVPPPLASGVSYDSFAFEVSDGEFASLRATNVLNVAPEPVIEPIGFSGEGADSAFSFSFTGVPNLRYQVLSSKDLIHWSTIASTQSVSGAFTIVDPGVTSQPLRFYRIRAQ